MEVTKQQRMADRQKAFQAKYKMTIEKENDDNAKVIDKINVDKCIYIENRTREYPCVGINWRPMSAVSYVILLPTLSNMD